MQLHFVKMGAAACFGSPPVVEQKVAATETVDLTAQDAFYDRFNALGLGRHMDVSILTSQLYKGHDFRKVENYLYNVMKADCHCYTDHPGSLEDRLETVAHQLVEDFIFRPRFHVVLILTDHDIPQMATPILRRTLQDISMYPVVFVCIGLGPCSFQNLCDLETTRNRRVNNFDFIHFSELENLDGRRQFYYTFTDCPQQFAQYQKLLGFQNGYFRPPLATVFNYSSSSPSSSSETSLSATWLEERV